MKKFTINEKYFDKISNLSVEDKWYIFQWLISIANDSFVEDLVLSEQWISLFNRMSSDLEIEKIKQNKVSNIRREVSWVVKTSNIVPRDKTIKPLPTLLKSQLPPAPAPQPQLTQQITIIEKTKPLWELNKYNLHFPENKYNYSWNLKDITERYNKSLIELMKDEFEILKKYNNFTETLLDTDFVFKDSIEQARYTNSELVAKLNWDDHCFDKTQRFLWMTFPELAESAEFYIKMLKDEVKERTSILKYALNLTIMFRSESFYDRLDNCIMNVKYNTRAEWSMPYHTQIIQSFAYIKNISLYNHTNPLFKVWIFDLPLLVIYLDLVSTWKVWDWWDWSWIDEYYFWVNWYFSQEVTKFNNAEYSPLMEWEITFYEFIRSKYEDLLKVNLDNYVS